MATRTTQSEKGAIYFCTFTCFDWLPLFDQTELCGHFGKWLNRLNAKHIKTCAYVIMPNHIHALLYIPENFPSSINRMIGTGKRFMAYEIVARLKQKNDSALLLKMAEAVSYNDRAKGKLHQVFEPSFDAKKCETEKFLLQKLDYIHHNPVNGKWNLTENYVAYPHSSAAFYELGQVGEVEITHYADLF